MNDERKRLITVEDLIRLKRAERPPVEFWDHFDQELRAKQLAALVEKRVWWHRLPGAFAGLARYRIPIGMTAILAVTLVAVRTYQPGATTGVAIAAIQAEPVNQISAGTGSGSAVLGTISEESLGVYSAFEVREIETSTSGDVLVNSSSVPSVGFSQAVSLLGSQSNLRTTEPTQIGRLIAANLAAAQAAEPAVTRSLFGAAYGSEARILPAKAAAVEPLSQMASPSEARRARLQSAMATMMSSSDAPLRTGGRLTSQISDERLYDQAHRLSGRGDRLSFKF